jgi:hypothetical protein
MEETEIRERKEEILPIFAKEEINEFLDEANKLLESDGRTSIAQACEKFYKVTEELIKILAEEHLPDEWREAEKIGRWIPKVLFTAVDTLMMTEGKSIKEVWTDAWVLHTVGFHENLLSAEEVSAYVGNIRNLVERFNQGDTHRTRASGMPYRI